MTTMHAEIYDALMAAGAPEEKARAAAAAVSDAKAGERLADDVKALRADVSDLKSDMRLMKWMLGVIAAGIVSLIGKAFFG